MRAVLAAGVIAVMAACTSSGPPIPATTPTSVAVSGPPTAGLSPTSAASAQPIALAESRRLVDIALLPPGAEATSSTPVHSLEQPPEEPSSPYLLDTPGWWSVPSTASYALTWLRDHPPQGVRAITQGSATLAGGAEIRYLKYGGHATPDYTFPTMLIAVAPDGSGGSAVRVDGQTMWIPPRPAREFVPTDVSRVHLLAYRGAGAAEARQILAHRTLAGADATKFVRLANALPRDNRGMISCAFDAGFRLSVSFDVRGQSLVFTDVPACGSVSVALDGKRLPALASTPAFYRAITSALPGVTAS